MKRAIDILQAIQWALEAGHAPALILDENSPIRDDMREALKPIAPPEPCPATPLDVLDALREIAKGEGPYSRDPYTHACNTIDAMKALALDAIAKATDAGERA